MTRRKKSYSAPTTRGLSVKALFQYQNGNLGATLLALFFLIFPWWNTGVLDQTTAIFGMTFLTIAIMRAKPRNCVLSGLFQAFIGAAYLFAVAGLLAVQIMWAVTILLFILFLVFELGVFKIGPVTDKADAFQVVPMTIIAFALITALAGYGNIYVIDLSNLFEALEYLGVMLFCFVSVFQVAGWEITGNQKSTSQLILVLALLTIAASVMGIYQGTLFAFT